jgi:hypothetical protein
MIIKIGKAEDNDFVINNPDISRYHAVLTKDEKNCYYLEDIGSTNGTYVNNMSIVKKKVLPTDKVIFGESFVITINDLLKKNNDYSEEFYQLKTVYDEYIKEKIKIQSSNQFKVRLLQTLPFVVLGVVSLIIGFFKHSNSGMFTISLFLAVLIPSIGFYFAARQASKIPAKLQHLANQFKIDYVCPKCGTYMGEIPWESLRNKKQCPVSSCKAKWVCT